MGSPSIKLRMMENFGRKMTSIGCKWSSFNAPGIETLVSHPFSGESLFLIYRSHSQKTIERGCAEQCNNLPTEKYSQAEAKSEIAKPPDLWSTLLSLFHEKVCLKSSFYYKIYSVGSQIIRPSGTRIRVITVCKWLRLHCAVFTSLHEIENLQNAENNGNLTVTVTWDSFEKRRSGEHYISQWKVCLCSRWCPTRLVSSPSSSSTSR